MEFVKLYHPQKQAWEPELGSSGGSERWRLNQRIFLAQTAKMTCSIPTSRETKWNANKYLSNLTLPPSREPYFSEGGGLVTTSGQWMLNFDWKPAGIF
eukprot:1324921-Amorphochlora_amoeboformis.AAC.1